MTFWELIISWFNLDEKPMESVIQVKDLVYNTAKASLGKDLVNDPTIPNEVQCAAALNAVFKKATGKPIGGGASTAEMFKVLKSDPRFKQVEGYAAKRIIISPTGTSTKGSKHGHCGLIGFYGIMSNNSMDGLWSEYYTDHSWTSYYHDKLGFPIYYFDIL